MWERGEKGREGEGKEMWGERRGVQGRRREGEREERGGVGGDGEGKEHSSAWMGRLEVRRGEGNSHAIGMYAGEMERGS
jgi:hypothetical protein